MRSDVALASPTGMLLNTSRGGRTNPWCSASLTRSDAILTAFHCVSSIHSGDILKVFFPYEGVREVDLRSIRPFCFHPDKSGTQLGTEGCSEWTNDLAVLELKTPYSLLKPLKLGDASAARKSSKVVIAGFGYQDEALSIYGVSHQGETVISECEVGTDRALCFRFNRAKSAETRIGPFDSGGPMFTVNKATGEKSLIGVALGSEPVEGSGGDVKMARYVNLTDPFYRDWLDREAFSGNAEPTAYSIETLVRGDVRELQPGEYTVFTLNIEVSSRRLLLTLNHDPGPSLFPNNLDLQFPSSLEAACERLASVEVCTVDDPPAGSYRISVGWGEACGADGEYVDPVYGSTYQVTAIALYAKPEAGE